MIKAKIEKQLIDLRCFKDGFNPDNKKKANPAWYGSVPDYERICEKIKNKEIDKEEIKVAADFWRKLDPSFSGNKTLFILGHVIGEDIETFLNNFCH